MRVQNVDNTGKYRKVNFGSVYPVYHWHKPTETYVPAFDIKDVKRYQRTLTKMLNSRISGGKEHSPSTFLQSVIEYLAKNDSDYKELKYTRSFFNYKGGIKTAWNGNVYKIEPMAYLLTGRDAVDFENLYGKPIGYSTLIAKQYEDECMQKTEMWQVKDAYKHGGMAFVKDLLGKFRDKETNKELELHTIYGKIKLSGGDKLLKLQFFQKGSVDNPFTTNGIM